MSLNYITNDRVYGNLVEQNPNSIKDLIKVSDSVRKIYNDLGEVKYIQLLMLKAHCNSVLERQKSFQLLVVLLSFLLGLAVSTNLLMIIIMFCLVTAIVFFIRKQIGYISLVKELIELRVEEYNKIAVEVPTDE